MMIAFAPVHHAHTSIAQIAAGTLFALALCTLLAIGLLLLCLVFVNFLTRLIQSVFPTFMTHKRTLEEGESPEQTRTLNRKIAYDFVLLEQRKRRAAVNVTQEEFQRFQQMVKARLPIEGANLPVNQTVPKEDTVEWNLEFLQQTLNSVKPKASEPDKDLISQAQFHLLIFPDGPQNPPRYLCASRGRGDTLRHAFANVRSKSIRMDYVSAHRLAASLPGHVFVAPANAAGRLWLRNEGSGKQEGRNAKHATA